MARKILLDQLTGRARSRKELGDKLASKQVPDEIATRLLDRFEEVGLVDDDAFARSWVSQRQSADGGGKGLARRALAQELRRKGVDDETAREALDDVDPGAEEESRPRAGPPQAALADPGRRHRRHPSAGRDAGPQGLLVRARLQRRP